MASSYVHRESENGIIIFWFKITYAGEVFTEFTDKYFMHV